MAPKMLNWSSLKLQYYISLHKMKNFISWRQMNSWNQRNEVKWKYGEGNIMTWNWKNRKSWNEMKPWKAMERQKCIKMSKNFITRFSMKPWDFISWKEMRNQEMNGNEKTGEVIQQHEMKLENAKVLNGN